MREPLPLTVPAKPNEVWSADFMSDALYNGVRFRTFNVLDDFNREALAIDIDTSLPSRRLGVFEQLKAERSLPDVLRTDNVPPMEVRVSSAHRSPLQPQAANLIGDFDLSSGSALTQAV